jgi:hypothetical protein
MKNIISERFARNSLFAIFTLMVIFHLLVISRIIPFDMVWGGRLKDSSQMLAFETVSVIINLVMLAVVAIQAGLIKVSINRIIIKIAFWIMCALFLINTIGNLFSNNEFERLVFTPLTLLLFIFCLRLAMSNDARIAK